MSPKRHISDDSIFHDHSCESQKSSTDFVFTEFTFISVLQVDTSTGNLSLCDVNFLAT
jgi:hypothetical protein